MPNFTPDGKRNQLLGFIVGIVLFILLGAGSFLWIFADRVYPGIYINYIPVGGLTKKEAWEILQQKLPPIENRAVFIQVDGVEVASSSSELSIRRDYDQAIEQSYRVGRVGAVWKRVGDLTRTLVKRYYFTIALITDDEAVNQAVNILSEKINVPGKVPSAELEDSRFPNSLSINPGLIGREVDVSQTKKRVLEEINKNQWMITAPVASVGAELTDDQVIAAKEKAKRLVGERIILRASNVRIEINDQQLVELLSFPDGINQEKLQEHARSWESIVARPAEDAVFEYNHGTLEVISFKPHRDGLSLKTSEALSGVEKTLNSLLSQEEKPASALGEYHDTELELPVEVTQSTITLEKTNDLGIKEVIGVGESEYDHSIPNRIHNVAITTERINHTIIPPGAEFSFNKTLGEVSGATGYRSAYVIKNGRTELGDGGGVCQVSTTVFRAVLDAGLNVTRRLPHSYRVSYYELNAKPGIDATVYAGETDFRFINDTDHHVLLRSEADSKNLYMKVELYGTSDGRTTEIKDHEVWGYVSAPPPEFYPDPSLRPGQRRQIDWSVAGVKAKFTHVVRDKDGTIMRENTYQSNYRPWSAKYLIGV